MLSNAFWDSSLQFLRCLKSKFFALKYERKFASIYSQICFKILVKNVLLKFDLKILLYPTEFYYILLYPKHLVYTKQFDMNYLTFLKNMLFIYKQFILFFKI